MPNLNEALIQAIHNKDVVAAGKIIPQLNNPSIVEQHGFIQRALSKNDAAMLKLLFDNNMRLSFALENDILEKSVEMCSLDVVKVIAEQLSTHVNETNALYKAVQRGDLSIIKFLCEMGADVNRRDEGDRTPLEYVVLNEKNLNPLVAKFLIDRGANVYAYSHFLDAELVGRVKEYFKKFPIEGFDNIYSGDRVTKLENEVTMLRDRLAVLEKQFQELNPQPSMNRTTLFR